MKRELSQFKYLFTKNYVDIYAYGCLRIGIERETGKQVLGYVMPKGMEYTKGEWAIMIGTDGKSLHVTATRYTSDGDLHSVDRICEVVLPSTGYRVQAEANAHLIAAAPAMYEELKYLPEPKSILAEAAYTGGDVPKKWIAEHGQFCDGYNQALKDIAKHREQALAKAGEK
ncbi:hypothetical protein LCGC14_2143220 [marine sediment metagenome]|uniref:Uncharacterized protein n=1 Tax=marine sediment metagenome TaxID=412755 RepID=A0A0F9GU00_9ZZZZ